MPTLEWRGKDKVINHHLDVPFKVLDYKYTYNTRKTNDESSSQNKIIRGDNFGLIERIEIKEYGELIIHYKFANPLNLVVYYVVTHSLHIHMWTVEKKLNGKNH
ncbi:hypothetical protein RJD24_12140 [Bacillaceae bacterium IKA-2]|nr:hypothetical protein RJD24_12140 [Bacillaceae bacterium IKA-2]